jgi:hypothetical protein
VSRRPSSAEFGRRCHEPGAAAIGIEAGTDAPETPTMPAFEVGDVLDERELQILHRLAALVHEIDPNIPAEAVQPERTLWEIGYDSLALVALRLGVKRVFGPQIQALLWLRLHAETPRIGCFVRFLAASGATG